MLSKKQAQVFFIGGTAVTFMIFIGLTIFSFSKGQDQSNYENITEEELEVNIYGKQTIAWGVTPC